MIGKISDKTVYSVYKVMKNMFNRAVVWEFIEKIPLNKVKIKKLKYKEINFYFKQEIFEILKYRQVSTFELPKNTVIVVTAKEINENTINEEIYSLVAHIKG